MLALQRWGPAHTSATAVLNRHLVLLGDARLWVEDDTGINNEALGSVVVVVLSFPSCDCGLVLTLALQRLVWCFLLYNLHQYLDLHCESLWWPK